MKYYVCETTRSKSGIARYAEDFYKHVLLPRGYKILDPSDVDALLVGANKDAKFHIELGADRYAEKKVLLRLVARGFLNVNVTLHDPPFLTFPYYDFKFGFLNKISRAFDWYLNTFGQVGRVLRKCDTVYVLSNRGKDMVIKRHGQINIRVIPHIVPQEKVAQIPISGSERDIVFFGFIGPGKGLDYALRLHQEILKFIPDVTLHVIGDAIDKKGVLYLNGLKKTFNNNVVYHGYVSEDRLDEIFCRVGHVFLPFREYKYICPVSGSAINALRRGKVLWTNPVNALPEIVTDGVNGVYFKPSIEKNVLLFGRIDEFWKRAISVNALASLDGHAFGTELYSG